MTIRNYRIRNKQNKGHWRAATDGWTTATQATAYTSDEAMTELTRLLRKPKYHDKLEVVQL
jgi:hypothetical protein